MQVLYDINVDVYPGEIVSVIGANGAGKSTLMKLLVAALLPTSGSILVDGQPLLKTERQLKAQLGYLPQDFGYYPGFTGEAFLWYMGALKGLPKAQARRRAKELLELVGLSQAAKGKIKTYSGGMKQRLGIAQALLGHPIPEDVVRIDRNMTLGEMGHGRSPIGWLAAAVLGALLRRSIKKGKPDLNILFQYNMPLRALSKMTNGAISMGMVDGIVMELQGFWIIGLVRVIVEAVKNLVLNSRMEERLKNS